MSPRTQAVSPTDKGMWRRLLTRAHPDAGGDGELFVWTTALREHVAGDAIKPEAPPRPRRTHEADTDRVPFEAGVFSDLTYCALVLARSVPEPYATLLGLLADCGESFHGPLAREQRRGASYRRLAAIGHAVGMSKAERVRFYRIAESVPPSDRHAGHILSRLDRRAA
jgi:hypothetical protein